MGQETYNQILGSMSSGAIILASLAGYFAGSFTNATLMAVMKLLTKGKLLWSRGHFFIYPGGNRPGGLPVEPFLEPDSHQLYLQSRHRSLCHAPHLLGRQLAQKS